MQYQIQHTTQYNYAKTVDLGPHVVRLRPTVHAKSRVLSYSLTVEPDCQIRWQYDPWNNLIARLVFPQGLKTEALSICVDAVIETEPVNPFDFYVEPWCENLPFAYPELVKKELSPFLEKTEGGPLFEAFLKNFEFKGSIVDFLVKVNSTVYETIEYTTRYEAGIQTSEETLEISKGSCRDSALLIMEILRSFGLAARFVSGYLIQENSHHKKKYLLDLHAWAEVYLPGAGWIGLDGTSGLLCGEGHIPLACTVTPEQASPVSGTASEASSQFNVISRVELIGDEVSPDMPYSRDTYREILKTGDAIDSLLASYGIVLTSGGEPTFTASDLSKEPEWFTGALGKTKLERASQLFEKLFSRFGEGPLPIFGTGKLYPGEVDPRWAMTLLWRADGEPIWLNKDLLFFNNGENSEIQKDPTGSEDPSVQFLKELADKLNVQANTIAGYEDPVQLVISEENLPCEEDLDEVAGRTDLTSPDERKRLAKLLDKGAGEVVGYALPLTKLSGNWYSNSWKFKRKKMFLLPGSSPMGLRLPLDRIISRIESDFAQDPSLARGELPPRLKETGGSITGDTTEKSENNFSGSNTEAEILDHQRDVDKQQNKEQENTVSGDHTQSNSQSPVTALCVQNYDGGIGVFIPPLASTDDYLELIETIEEVSAITGIRVRVEGYAPPPDLRLRSIALTPDPGVLEVNMPVCAGLREYARALDLVADAASECNLGTEKYQLDGRIVGTGGGHHITLGGPTTLESPFIKHPQTLASLVRFFQNHPSLSFFFTGLFVGPHSQAPRIDEARLESLYELELALSQFPVDNEAATPWLTDRLLRNILVDMTGNTHRAEICIDKLYNPEIQTGRLGLVELRAFEMPFHFHMAVVQVLLVRAIIARFITEPYKEKLISWSDNLHDKFMLPHYLWKDLSDVVSDLNARDIKIKLEWFKPFMEFRFPVLGVINREELQMELRVAHEPWHILSVVEEEIATTSRPVDSSMERIQVKVNNFNPERHKVIVNGIELNMRETSLNDEFIGAVRFRAWHPPNCMHPNIEVHHPLKFEIIDFWSKRSLVSCQYHVVHPEGRLYEELPLTRHDAEARQNRRFTQGNHTPWPVEFVRVEDTSSITLDLRLYSKAIEKARF